MHCKTRSTTYTTEVVEGVDICSSIYDFTDYEDDSLTQGNANVGQQDPTKPKKSRKHKSKSKHKRRRRKERRKEKRQKKKEQEQRQQEELAQHEAHTLEEKKNGHQRSTKTKRPAVPVEISCDSITK